LPKKAKFHLAFFQKQKKVKKQSIVTSASLNLPPA